MSIQPLNTFGMADEFFNVYLHTSECLNKNELGHDSKPIWNLAKTGLMGDRYKFFKKCIGVVNFVVLPTSANGATAGKKYLIRDVNNSQSNSTDTLLDGQSNIIYSFQTGGDIASTDAGFPYLVTNPFGTQQLMITEHDSINPPTDDDEITTSWGIHITYYFYKNN